MKAVTPARAGLARSGVTRSGWPVAQGQRLNTYALSNVARSGATRSNFIAPSTFVSIGGVPFGCARTTPGRVLDGSLALVDVINEGANTASFTVYGAAVHEGAEVIITLGSINNGKREFAGWILNVQQRYLDSPSYCVYDVNAIDYTWGLSRRVVSTRYASQTVATIVQSLVSTWSTGYTVAVAADAASQTLDEITFTAQPLADCLTQTCKRVGVHWRCDDHRVVRVFDDDQSQTPPSLLNAVHPTLTRFDATYDLSQVVTRVLSEGGGGTAMTTIVPGETIIPVDTAVWYEPTGTVATGTQRLPYTGVGLGRAGSLVGPGAAPVAVMTADFASGTGVDSGTHDYAMTFVTAAGESLPGPKTTITVGVVAPPATAPTAGTPQPGNGPEPGGHLYAVSFVTASGETTPSPTVSVTTGTLAAPNTAPSIGQQVAGGSIDDGTHDYAYTVVTAVGETTPSPISAGATAGGGGIPNPIAQVSWVGTASGSVDVGWHDYAYTFVDGAGRETTIGASLTTFHLTAASGITFQVPNGNPGTVARKLYRTAAAGSGPPAGGALHYIGTINNNNTVNYTDTLTDAAIAAGAAPPSANATALRTINLFGILPGPAGTTARRIYRRSGGVGLRMLDAIANNTTQTYTDTAPNAALGGAPPSTNTATACVVPLSAIPTGGALVTARKLYRTAANQSALKALTTLADNTTTTYIDSTLDAALGATAPSTNTAAANQVALSGIATGIAAVTARKVYRTAAGQTQLKALTTIADNTTTTFLDATADAILGANAPTGDASGLQQPAGVVLAGSTSLTMAGTAGMPTAGWAVIGNGEQVIRYTGISGQTLTGIPATGIGSITASIAYNSTITAAPQLTGIPATGTGAITVQINRGDAVNLLVTVDDVAAQLAFKNALADPTFDGVQEDYLSDNRLSATEARSRARSWLNLRKDVHVAVHATTRDLNSRTGTTLTVNLGAFALYNREFMVQHVTESAFHPALMPTFDIDATSVRFTFEDWLRIVKREN